MLRPDDRSSTPAPPGARPALLGVGPGFQDLVRRVHRVARTDATVLVSGETGTGKEVVARAIHEMSPRRPGPFVPVDCAAVVDELFDSEVFGHGRGAFTGAERARPGKVAAAQGGTLFLDAIDCLSAGCQSRLLRVIQEKEVLPLGHSRPRAVDFRLVTSVSDGFQSRLATGDFRRDLFFRINVVHLRLPPLRERREDIHVLADRFLRDVAGRFGKPVRRIDAKALTVLESYDWPGNIRELRNVIECAVASARGEILFESDLPIYVRRQAARPSGAAAAEAPAAVAPADAAPAATPTGPSFGAQVEEFQRRLLTQALARTGWSYRDTGAELGLSHHQVKYLCAKLGVRRARFDATRP